MITYTPPKFDDPINAKDRSRVANFTDCLGKHCEISTFTNRNGKRVLYIASIVPDDDGDDTLGAVQIDRLLACAMIRILQRFVDSGDV